MGLKLTVISEQREQLGSAGCIVFGVAGGGIGRSHDNDWVLPDPQRYLSAHHARVQFRDGGFFLLDTSTNGVYVNDGTIPIGRRSQYPLRHGDRLRLGDYEMAVHIDGDTTLNTEASSIFPVNAPPVPALRGSAADIGADLSLLDLMLPDPAASNRIGPLDAFGQPLLTEDTGLLAFDSGQRALKPAATHAGVDRQELRTADRALESTVSAFDAFCRGAGLDSKALKTESPARLLQLAGVLLREALLGLKGLALAQREIREQTQIQVGKEDPQHIGLTGLPVDDLLLRLLLGHDRHDLDAVQWVREMLASTRRHDQAAVRALHVALPEFIARLEPLELAESDPRGELAGGAAEPGRLSARFRNITEMVPGKLPHLFTEAFARAFVAAYRTTGSPETPGP
jgi:predicted component of type VI protein secretion system